MNIYDIAKKSNVSIATVSRVLNEKGAVSEKTRKRVLEVIAKADYTPNVFARGLNLQSMKTIGVLAMDVSDVYYAAAVHTIEQILRERGYDLLLCSTGESLADKKKYVKLLLDKQVDGLILVGSVFQEMGDNAHIFEAAARVPVVLLNAALEGENIYSVVCDDYFGAFSAVEFLLKQGHTSLGFFYSAESFSCYEKRRGFEKALEIHGLDPDSGLVLKVSKDLNGGFAAMDELLRRGGFSAVLCAEDILAAGALGRCHAGGLRVPEDMALFGYDNSLIAGCTYPALTTVDSRGKELAAAAAESLVSVLEKGSVPAKTLIRPQLVLRDSV